MTRQTKMEDHERRIEKLEKKVKKDASRAEIEAEARTALLSYYASQLVSHAGILLTITLIAFGALDTLKKFDLYWAYFPTLVMLGCIAMWQVFRFVYLGQLSGRFMRVPIDPRFKVDSVPILQALHWSVDNDLRKGAIGIRRFAYVFANPATKIESIEKRKEPERSLDRGRQAAFHIYLFFFCLLGCGPALAWTIRSIDQLNLLCQSVALVAPWILLEAIFLTGIWHGRRKPKT